MSTFIINLNDTIAMSDSAIVELAKVINTCQPCVQEAGTNCNDIAIAGIICLAIVIIAIIAKGALESWKKAEQDAADAERKAKEEKEEVESKRKREADCQGKLIDFLEKQVSSFDIQKKEYEKASEDYKDFLLTIINSDNQQKDTQKEELQSYLENQINKYDKQNEEYNKACECYKKELKDLIEKMK